MQRNSKDVIAQLLNNDWQEGGSGNGGSQQISYTCLLADIDSCELEDDRILFYVYFLKLTVAQIQFSSVQSLSHV